MIILGICDSHEAHAALLVDGRLVAAMAEERLSRLKADSGYPYKSIDAVLRLAGVAPAEIDIVAIAGRSGALFQQTYKMQALFSVQDYLEQNRRFWKPILLEGKSISPVQDFDWFKRVRKDIESDPYQRIIDEQRQRPEEEWNSIAERMRRRFIADHLGIPETRIKFYRHEDCHKVYGFYSAPTQPNAALVLTVEGGGDDSSATASTVSSSTLEEHWRSNEVMLGRLYRYVTLLLGMKPGQHEYKVMGLAPYGTEYHGQRSLEFFRRVNVVEGPRIIHPRLLKDMYFSVRDALEGERFDGIAWGLQTFLEELLCTWVKNCVSIYHNSNVILSGGVAQNIKACKALADLPEVSSFWAGPISGDGSLGIGAAWLAAREFDSDHPVEQLESIYLGTEPTSRDITAAIERRELRRKFRIIERPTPDLVSGWLENDKVVARFSGRMEFGQRALGNRSILADPRRADSVERINRKIKYRDFWMPFTPSMLDSDADDMLVNPKKINSPYMTMAFDLKRDCAARIPAAIHPADKTARPQMLRRSANPAYYDLIEAFKRRSSIGVLLNTSFNLHGDAIVESPDDAITTFEKSDLDVLVFDDVAISRSSD